MSWRTGSSTHSHGEHGRSGRRQWRLGAGRGGAAPGGRRGGGRGRRAAGAGPRRLGDAAIGVRPPPGGGGGARAGGAGRLRPGWAAPRPPLPQSCEVVVVLEGAAKAAV